MNDTQLRSTKRKLKILMDSMQHKTYIVVNNKGNTANVSISVLKYWITIWSMIDSKDRLEIMQRCNQVWKQLPTSAPYMRHI